MVQETWLAALRTPPDPTRPARPWLGEILRNAWRMAARSTKRRHLREHVHADCAPEAVPSQDEVLARAQVHRLLSNLVMSLEEPYRTAILLRYHEGHRAKDIADALGLPAGTVRWRLTEGLARLRKRLDDTNEGKNWRVLLLPLAGPPPRGPGSSLPAASSPARWLAAMGAVGVGIVGLALSTGRPQPEGRRPQVLAAPAITARPVKFHPLGQQAEQSRTNP